MDTEAAMNAMAAVCRAVRSLESLHAAAQAMSPSVAIPASATVSAFVSNSGSLRTLRLFLFTTLARGCADIGGRFSGFIEDCAVVRAGFVALVGSV